MKAYYGKRSLNIFILSSAVGLTLLGTPITGAARDVFDETAIVAGIQWNFRKESLSLVMNLQSAKVTTSGVVRGWQTKFLFGHDATFHGMSMEWFKGDRRIQPTWGVGYDASSNVAQAMGGLQSKYLYGGVSYDLDQQWEPHIGITPFGSFSKDRVRVKDQPKNLAKRTVEKKI